MPPPPSQPQDPRPAEPESGTTGTGPDEVAAAAPRRFTLPPPPRKGPRYPGGQTQIDAEDLLWWTTLSVLCCCPPTGAIASFYGFRALNEARDGNREQAIASMRLARIWVAVSIVVFVAVVVHTTLRSDL